MAPAQEGPCLYLLAATLGQCFRCSCLTCFGQTLTVLLSCFLLSGLFLPAKASLFGPASLARWFLVSALTHCLTTISSKSFQ